MIFQSTHAAKRVFTLNNRSPKSDGAFGDVLLEGSDREAFLRGQGEEEGLRTPNGFAAMNVQLRQSLKYFDRTTTTTINVRALYGYSGILFIQNLMSRDWSSLTNK